MDYYNIEATKIYKRRLNTKIQMPLDTSLYYDYDSTTTGMVTRSGTSTGLSHLITHCKNNDITVGAALMASTSFAIAKVTKSMNSGDIG